MEKTRKFVGKKEIAGMCQDLPYGYHVSAVYDLEKDRFVQTDVLNGNWTFVNVPEGCMVMEFDASTPKMQDVVDAAEQFIQDKQVDDAEEAAIQAANEAMEQRGEELENELMERLNAEVD